MKRQWGFIQPFSLEHYIVNRHLNPLAIAIMCWLIEQLYIELGEELADVDLDVGFVGKEMLSKAPCIWIDTPDLGHQLWLLENKIGSVCDTIMLRTSATDLMMAIIEDGIDWIQFTKELYEKANPAGS